MIGPRLLIVALPLAARVACSTEGSSPTAPSGYGALRTAATTAQMRQLMRDGNAALSASGSNLRIGTIEWYTDEPVEAGNTVYFSSVGNKQLTSHWVAGDPRREWNDGTGITYLVDQSDGSTLSGLPNADTEPAIDRAMATWDGLTCSDIPIEKVADPAVDPDYVDFLLGFGPPPVGDWPYADIVHAGWTLAFAPPTLGVTFTLIWVDGGVPTDIDHNGKADTALREIYYSSYYVWQIDGNIDVETVALHEAGHGLSQGHFGTLFKTTANGKFHFSPLAVMNAGYTQVQQSIGETDLGGHCSIWSRWPN